MGRLKKSSSNKARPISISLSVEDFAKLDFVLKTLKLDRTEFFRGQLNDMYRSLYNTMKKKESEG